MFGQSIDVSGHFGVKYEQKEECLSWLHKNCKEGTVWRFKRMHLVLKKRRQLVCGKLNEKEKNWELILYINVVIQETRT